MTSIRKTAATAAVLAAGALAGPATAGAYTNPGPGGPEPITSTPTTVSSGPSSGFDWGDAGIGAAGALALLGLGAGTVALVRRDRREHPAVS